MRISSFVKVVAVLALVAVPSLGAVPSFVVEARQQAKKPSAEFQAYLDFRKEVAKAKRLEDVYFNFDKQTGEYYKSLSPAERAKILEGLKKQVDLFPEINVVKEERHASGATLTLTALSGDKATKATVLVEMLREGAMLKVGPSQWGQ